MRSFSTLLVMFFIFFIHMAHASERYFLCGPDEDGCPSNDYKSCLCMPYDEGEARHRYCLNLDNLSCVPLKKVANCPKYYIYKDQSTCVSIAFQSEATPPCKVVSHKFCHNNHVVICDIDGGVDSCKARKISVQ